jgi:CheY-like chemotaxis protein
MLPALGWLVRRAPLQPPHWLRHGVLLLAGVFAVALVRDWAIAPLVLPIFGSRAAPPRGLASVFANATIYLAVVLALHGRLYYRRLRAQEVEGARLAQRLAETQLTALRAQLQPHFLFNTLNAISALMHDEPDVADRMLTRLAELLRAVLEPPPGDEHALADELTVLERYLDIMSLRFGPRLSVEIAVAPDVRDARVPWLVLQPLVENALEHGAARRRAACRCASRRPACAPPTASCCASRCATTDPGRPPPRAAGAAPASGWRTRGVGWRSSTAAERRWCSRRCPRAARAPGSRCPGARERRACRRRCRCRRSPRWWPRERPRRAPHGAAGGRRAAGAPAAAALLARHPRYEVAAECEDGVEAIEQILTLRPALVFLDIHMPELDGVAVAEALAAEAARGGAVPAIVFVTAYDAHAVRAFDLNAVDYVLKPVDVDRFDRALTRAGERLEARRAGPRPPSTRRCAPRWPSCARRRSTRRASSCGTRRGCTSCAPTRSSGWTPRATTSASGPADGGTCCARR